MNVILVIITTVLSLFTLFLYLGAFLGTFANYRAVKKRIKRDQTRSEKGEAVLLKESFLYDLFYYADKDFSVAAPPADPLGIYSPLLAAKWIFTLSQVILIVTLVGVGIALFITLTGSEAEAEGESKFKAFMRMAFPMIMSVLMSLLMIVYINAVYKKLYLNQIWPQIQANQTKLNALHTLILGSLALPADTEFYNALNSEQTTLDALHSSLTKNALKPEIIRRLTTLSIRDYYMAEVPSYASSAVPSLFIADTTKQLKDPGLYIRIDCSRTIQNYAYKYDKILNAQSPAAQAEILAGVSEKLNAINKQISVVRLESQPMVALIENFFRISTYYYLFTTVIVLAILVGWYNLGCLIKRGWLWVKYFFLKLKVKALPAKKDANGNEIANDKETRMKELETEYDKETGKLSCVKPTADAGAAGGASVASGAANNASTPPAGGAGATPTTDTPDAQKSAKQPNIVSNIMDMGLQAGKTVAAILPK